MVIVYDDFFWKGGVVSVEMEVKCGQSSDVSVGFAILLAVLFEEFSIKEFFQFFFGWGFFGGGDEEDVFFEAYQVASIF